jgi:hypothetical protein
VSEWSDVPETPKPTEPPVTATPAQATPVSSSVSPQPRIVNAEVLHPDVVVRDNYSSSMVFGVDAGAVIALALAIASWIVLPVIGAIAALIIAPGATHRIRQANGELGTTGVVRAAQIIAIANLVVFVLLVWLLIAVIHSVL